MPATHCRMVQLLVQLVLFFAAPVERGVPVLVPVRASPVSAECRVFAPAPRAGSLSPSVLRSPHSPILSALSAPLPLSDSSRRENIYSFPHTPQTEARLGETPLAALEVPAAQSPSLTQVINHPPTLPPSHPPMGAQSHASRKCGGARASAARSDSQSNSRFSGRTRTTSPPPSPLRPLPSRCTT